MSKTFSPSGPESNGEQAPVCFFDDLNTADGGDSGLIDIETGRVYCERRPECRISCLVGFSRDDNARYAISTSIRGECKK